MPNFAFWLSLPLMLPQAMWIRRRTPRFRGPADELCGVIGKAPQQRIIGIGDSIIAGVGARTPADTITARLALRWHEATGFDVAWEAYGRIGARSTRIGQMAESLAADDRVTVVLLSAGVNDITGLTRVAEWLESIDRIIDTLLEKYPAAIVVLLGIPPLDTFPALPSPLREVLGSRARYFDRRARRHLEARERCCYCPIERRPSASEFAADGFHPSVESYAALAAAIAELVLQKSPGNKN